MCCCVADRSKYGTAHQFEPEYNEDDERESVSDCEFASDQESDQLGPIAVDVILTANNGYICLLLLVSRGFRLRTATKDKPALTLSPFGRG